MKKHYCLCYRIYPAVLILAMVPSLLFAMDVRDEAPYQYTLCQSLCFDNRTDSPDESLLKGLLTQEEHRRLLMAAALGDRHELSAAYQGGVDLHELRDTNGQGVLAYAAVGGQINMLAWLMALHTFSLHQIHRRGTSILHYAAWGGHRHVIVWLVMHKFDIHQQNEDGWNILHFAAAGGHLELIEWLVYYRGFDVNSRTRSGYSVVDCAEASGNTSLVFFLRSLI